MEKVTRGLPGSPARRVARIARVGARYGFGFVLGNRFVPRRRRADPRRVGTRLRLSFEELGPTFAELGRFLAARRDLLPPDVAAELERTTVLVEPLSFAEARALIERELGNTLERLFLEFEEVPTRVGTFTQAHRASLPGERPALVVVVRPGVRRDLLAMRPVADLARRRLSDRLPLDPSAAVAEFAAHAAQRRDMFFAAQTARRLKETEGLRLMVPDVYRGYSSARCVTFEAVADPSPLADEHYRDVSGALVRLALAEGIFLAELSPERFAADGPEVWLADPTEMFSLDPERLRGVAEVMAAVRRGDVDGIARALPLAGGFIPRDDSILRRELRETMGALGGPLWREHSLEEIRGSGLEAVRRGDARLHVEVTQMVRSLVEAENLGGEGRTEIAAAAEAAEALISRHRDPVYVAARTARRLAQPDTFADYPRQLHTLLNELKDGEVEVRFRHAGLDELISKVDILANRLVFAFLIAALIIGSSMLGIFVEGGVRLFGVSVFGLIGFVFAAILGLLLLVGIIRSGRL
jgi:ubiquinone biosynthesis protein